MKRDLSKKISQEQMLAPVAVSAPWTSDAVDLSGANSIDFGIVYAGYGGTAGIEVYDDSVWAAVTNDLYVLGQTLATDGSFAITSGDVNRASYVGPGDQARVSGTVDIATTVAAHAVKGDLQRS